MERAAGKCFHWIKSRIGKNHRFRIFCGTGNNGGDGLVIARLLLEINCDVDVYIVMFSEKQSNDFITNRERLNKFKKINIVEIHKDSSFPEINANDIIIDAIFGSGLTKPVKGFTAQLISFLNNSLAQIIAVDIPSGLFGDDNRNNEGAKIRARHTLTFQQPKLSFLFSSNNEFVGEWHILDIRLHRAFIDNVKCNNYYTELIDCAKLYRPRNKFSHKGNFGHGLLISGSRGKIGATVLAARACLKTGAGLLTVHLPNCGYQIIQTSVPEAMAITDSCENHITDIIDIKDYNAIAVGPGLGMDESSAKVLKLVIQNSAFPLILDADALNILGENKTWLSFLPKSSILTPHPKEFERLTETKVKDIDRLKLQKDFSAKYSVYIILKGAHTTISCPDGSCYYNSTGNPGMATAGSGDVLTGILLGLLAQGYSPLETSVLGVYLHGLAGDISAERYGHESLNAGDIITYLGKAFKKIY
jgi:NAD(P)H-hydrate epimerase